MSLSRTVAEFGLIFKRVLYLFLRPFGASSIQGRHIIAEYGMLSWLGLLVIFAYRDDYRVGGWGPKSSKS